MLLSLDRPSPYQLDGDIERAQILEPFCSVALVRVDGTSLANYGFKVHALKVKNPLCSGYRFERYEASAPLFLVLAAIHLECGCAALTPLDLDTFTGTPNEPSIKEFCEKTSEL